MTNIKKKFIISKAVYAFLDSHPTDRDSTALIRETIQAAHSDVEIKSAAVCNAARRWRVKHGYEDPAPSDKVYPKKIKKSESEEETERIDSIEKEKEVLRKVYAESHQIDVQNINKVDTLEEPNEMFKKVLSLKKYADDHDTPMRVSDIINILDRTNQLNENQQDMIKTNEFIEEVAKRILDFSISIKKDPDIEDEIYIKRKE
jgi:hypothetical protein